MILSASLACSAVCAQQPERSFGEHRSDHVPAEASSSQTTSPPPSPGCPTGKKGREVEGPASLRSEAKSRVWTTAHLVSCWISPAPPSGICFLPCQVCWEKLEEMGTGWVWAGTAGAWWDPALHTLGGGNGHSDAPARGLSSKPSRTFSCLAPTGRAAR
ncbi:hypothetical protein VULLAG_LOCUS20711 [Vulpes lagopus]